MTRVYATKEGRRYTLTAKGHATGKPEVCAGVSAILYALAGYLANKNKRAEYRMDAADARFSFSGGRAAKAVFWMTLLGLMQIELKYPEFLLVEYRERG